MERRVLAEMPDALVARTSAFFGPVDDWNVVTRSLRALAKGESVWLADDVVISPTYVPDLVNASFDLLIDGANGIWHLANPGETCWAGLVRLAAKACGVNAARLCGCSQKELNQTAPRPVYSALGTERGQILPPFVHALSRYADAIRL